jgi:hypothetical protein
MISLSPLFCPSVVLGRVWMDPLSLVDINLGCGIMMLVDGDGRWMMLMCYDSIMLNVKGCCDDVMSPKDPFGWYLFKRLLSTIIFFFSSI